MKYWMLVIAMGLVTFGPRLLPMAFAGKVVIPEWLKSTLDFVPIAVLSAIIAQAAIVRDGNIELTFSNFHALAAAASFGVAILTRHLFLTIVAGLVCFGILRIIFGS